MTLTMGFGAYGASVMNTQMMIDWQLDRKSLGLAIGSFALTMGLVSPLAGVFVHRWGARTALSLGTLAMALGALAMATVVNSLVSLVLVYGLVMGWGAAMGSAIPAQTVVSYWFKKRLAMALTLTVMGSNLGGFIAAPLLAKVITASDGNWRMGWFVVAAACAIAFCCAVLFVRNKPSDIGQLQDGGEKSHDESEVKAGSPPTSSVYKTTRDWEFAEVVRHPASWWMIIGAVCSGAALGIVIGHGVAHFIDLGHSPEVAASFLGTVVGTGLGGRILFAVLGDRIEPRFVLSASLFLMALGMLLVIDATSVIELYASATLLGVGSALPMLCMAAMAINYFGQTAFSRFVGLAGLFMALTPAILVVVTGIVFDRMGSYTLVFYSATAAFILLGLVMPFVRPPALASR
ncbi:MAG: MFS transporter [Gammaproteobacteria bacterium]